MVVFDATTLLFIFAPRVGAPKDPDTGKPVDRAKERVDLRLKELQKSRTKVIIPTPALAEILVHAGSAAPEQLAKINGSSAFRVVDFDQRAAVQVALLAQDKSDRPKDRTDTYAKIKYDRQIAAIAKVEGATAVYTDDTNLRGYAKRLGIPVIGLIDLPLPAPPQAETLDLFEEHSGNAGKSADHTEEELATEVKDGSDKEPNEKASAGDEGDGLQPEAAGIQSVAEEDRATKANRDADVEEDLTSGAAEAYNFDRIEENLQAAGSSPATSTSSLDGGVAQRKSGRLNQQSAPVSDRGALSSDTQETSSSPGSPEKK